MNKLGIISLIFVLILQSCAPKWDPRKYRAIKITDSELIYSTYDLNKKEHEKDKLILTKKRQLPDSVFKKITMGYNESKWPPALQTPQLRYENRRKLKFYKAYIITEFKNKYIVYVPNSENKGSLVLPPEMMSDKDFYMIVGKSNVEKQDEFMKGYENWTPPVKKKEEAIAAAPTRATKVSPNSDLKALDKNPSKPDKPTVKPALPPTKPEKELAQLPPSKPDKKAERAADKLVKEAEKAEKQAKKEAQKQAAANEKAAEAEKDKQLNIKKGKNSKETRKRIKSERKKKKKDRKKDRKLRKKAREKAKKEKKKQDKK